jgi:hypothetical protein
MKNMGLEKKMKIGFNKLALAVILATVALPTWAAGTIIAVTVLGLTAGTFAAAATAFAINMVISAVITKAFFSPEQPSGGGLSGDSPNPGNRQQVPPATDNKLPVVYGSAWVGGIITDLSITQNNQILYYVISLSEVTYTNGVADEITFGDIYFGGKKVVFQANGSQVNYLLDESTGQQQPVDNRIAIYLYKNGSNSPVNSGNTAIQIMNDPNLIYKWDSTKLMTNCAFAILALEYSQNLGVTGIQQTKFNITNAKTKPGDVFLDYLQNETYGAALPLSQINTASFTALNTYSDGSFPYTTSGGAPATQARFKFDGVVDTSRSIMSNLQDMASCCDCLLKFNEITGQWGVVVQSPTYTVAMDVNDSNMVSAIQITPLDIAGSYNIIECKFPDSGNQDAFNTATFDLTEIAPSLLYPNEPVNKQSVSLPLVNNSVRAQYIATRMLKAGREDLQVQVTINFVGIQLEAGDIVSVTNSNYGWVAKLFRVMKITEQFSDNGAVSASVILTEFNASIYDDTAITQFTPSPNTGIGSPLTFGTIPAPTIVATNTSFADPTIVISANTSSSGITQYLELWYSAYLTPTTSQLIFAGTSEIKSNGAPYNINETVPNITLGNIPSGNWYFFTRMVNSLGSSPFSPASAIVNWRPTTFQYTLRYLSIAYADSSTGTGFSTTPTNKTYYGIANVSSANFTSTVSEYTWYPASPVFSTNNSLLYANRSNRKFSFATGEAAFLGLNAAFVPTDTSLYDQTVWSALENADNVIDLDARTGQVTRVGTTSVSSADGLVSVTNNTNGTMIVSLERFLNFGAGVYSKTFSPSEITIDIYGRVVGVTQQDDFYYTQSTFTATAGQTSFAVTHIVGQCLVFRNGTMMPSSDYSETSTTVVLTNACAAGEIVVVVSMRVVSYSDFYAPLNITIASNTSNTVTYTGLPNQLIKAGDVLSFTNSGTPSTFTVSTVNTTTKVITFTGSISGATAGNTIYQYRPTGASYVPFSKYEIDVSNISSYTPTSFLINNGFEEIFVNGSALNEIDYDLSGTTVQGFPGNLTGKMIFIIYTPNNLGIPCSNIVNTIAYTNAGQLTYVFESNPLAFELSANGVKLAQGLSNDYTVSAASYNLTNAFNNNFTLLTQQTFARIGAA